MSGSAAERETTLPDARRPEHGPLGEVLTLAEAAAYLRLPEDEVVRLVLEQDLPGRHTGTEWRFSKAAIEARRRANWETWEAARQRLCRKERRRERVTDPAGSAPVTADRSASRPALRLKNLKSVQSGNGGADGPHAMKADDYSNSKTRGGGHPRVTDATMQIRVYDHRVASDLDRQQTDDYLQHFRPKAPFLIMQGSGRAFDPVLKGVSQLLAQTGDSEFVYFRPWAPGVDAARRLFKQVFKEAIDLNPEQVAITSASASFAATILKTKAELGGPKAGVWLFGATSERDAVRAVLLSPMIATLPVTAIAEDLADLATMAVAFDEGGLTTVLLRLSEQTAAIADSLKASISVM